MSWATSRVPTCSSTSAPTRCSQRPAYCFSSRSVCSIPLGVVSTSEVHPVRVGLGVGHAVHRRLGGPRRRADRKPIRSKWTPKGVSATPCARLAARLMPEPPRTAGIDQQRSGAIAARGDAQQRDRGLRRRGFGVVQRHLDPTALESRVAEGLRVVGGGGERLAGPPRTPSGRRRTRGRVARARWERPLRTRATAPGCPPRSRCRAPSTREPPTASAQHPRPHHPNAARGPPQHPATYDRCMPQLRLALAQVNACVGDLPGNAELVLDAARRAGCGPAPTWWWGAGDGAHRVPGGGSGAAALVRHPPPAQRSTNSPRTSSSTGAARRWSSSATWITTTPGRADSPALAPQRRGGDPPGGRCSRGTTSTTCPTTASSTSSGTSPRAPRCRWCACTASTWAS